MIPELPKGPAALLLTEAHLNALLEHCRAEFPHEACGILAGRNGSVERVYRMTNVRPGPASYEMDPEEQFRVLRSIRQEGRSLIGIYHSHTGSPAFPSGIDVEQAYWPGTLFPNYPGAVYVIVSLMDRQNPDVKGFMIGEGRIAEVALQVL